MAARDEPYAGVFTVDVNTGQTRRLFLDIVSLANPRFAAGGKAIVYERMSNFPWTRPRYQGSGAAQLWRYDLGRWSSHGRRQERIPTSLADRRVWGEQGVLAVTVGDKTPSSSPMGKSLGRLTDSPARTPNVYNFEGGKAERLTNFTGGSGTRFLTAAKSKNVPTALRG